MLKPLTKRKRLLSFVLGAACIFAVRGAAHAVTYTFNFDPTSTTLADGSTNTQIQTYMQTILPGVTITGAVVERNYNGDNHVVGPNGVSQTLGTSDGGVHHNGGYDAFIVNNTSLATGTDTSTIVITFPFKISSVSFDYEIFPNGTCPSPSNCGTNQSNLPDFSLYAYPNGNPNYSGTNPPAPSENPLNLVLHQSANIPPSQCSNPLNTNWKSPLSNCEQAPQYLGTFSVSFSTGVTELDFVDWPNMIGIDNLVVTRVPEPSSMLLLGIGLIGLRSLMSRRGRKEEK